MKNRLVFATLLLAAAVFAPAQIEVTKADPPRKLSEVSESLLAKPKVLVAIKATDEQLMRAAVRMTLVPLREMVRQRIEGEDQSQWKLSIDGLPMNASQLRVSDLTVDQTHRLYEIALQQNTLSALLTDEIGLALAITPAQRTKLVALFKEVTTKGGKAVAHSPATVALQKAIQDMAKEMKTQDGEEPTMAQINKVFDMFTDKFPKLMAEAGKQSEPSWREGNARALLMLTPAQKRQLVKLQGKPLN